MNWPIFAMCFGAICTLIVLARAWKERPPFLGWLTAGFLLLNVAFNGAAPFRGALDPEYAGYHFGFLLADRGLQVTAIAGTLVVVLLAAAWIAVSGRATKAHWITAIVCLAAGFNMLTPALIEDGFAIFELGEFIRLEGVSALVMILGLTSLPFFIGAWWAARRALQAP